MSTAVIGVDTVDPRLPDVVVNATMAHVDPRAYGAKLDGVTDDSAAFATMTASIAAGSVVDFGGRTGVANTGWTFDKLGSQIVNGTLVVKDTNGLTITAPSVTLRNFSVTSTFVGTLTNHLVEASAVADGLRIDGGTFTTNTHQMCIYLTTGTNDVTIEHVTCTNSVARQDSSLIYNAAGASAHLRTTIRDCVLTSTGCAQGIALYDTSDGLVEGCKVSGCVELPIVTLTTWVLQSGNVYRTTDRSDGLTRVLFDNGTQRTENTATPTNPGTNEWGVSGGFVYLNLGGTDPNTRTITSAIVSGYGIYVYDTVAASAGNVIRDCTITDCDGFGIYLQLGHNGTKNIVSGCHLRNVCTGGIQTVSLPFSGIGVNSGSDTLIEATEIDNIGTPSTDTAPGMHFVNGATVKLRNVTVLDATSYGFKIQGSSVDATDCVTTNSTSVGWRIETTTAVDIAVRLKGCGSDTSGSHGLETSVFAGSSIRLTVDGGLWNAAALRGMNLSEVTALKVVNATIKDWAAAQQGLILAGTAGCVDAVIANNEFVHSTSTATALNISAASTGCTARGNKFSSAMTTPYVFSAPVDHDRRATSTTSASSVTTNASMFDRHIVSALAANLTINAPTGTPADEQELTFLITDNGTSRTLTWNGALVAANGLTLPATTTTSKRHRVACRWDAAASVWRAYSITVQA